MIELEDFFEDVIGKTIRGTGIADGVLSFLTNVEPDAIAKLKNGAVSYTHLTLPTKA